MMPKIIGDYNSTTTFSLVFVDCLILFYVLTPVPRSCSANQTNLLSLFKSNNSTRDLRPGHVWMYAHVPGSQKGYMFQVPKTHFLARSSGYDSEKSKNTPSVDQENDHHIHNGNTFKRWWPILVFVVFGVFLICGIRANNSGSRGYWLENMSLGLCTLCCYLPSNLRNTVETNANVEPYAGDVELQIQTNEIPQRDAELVGAPLLPRLPAGTTAPLLQDNPLMSSGEVTLENPVISATFPVIHSQTGQRGFRFPPVRAQSQDNPSTHRYAVVASQTPDAPENTILSGAFPLPHLQRRQRRYSSPPVRAQPSQDNPPPYPGLDVPEFQQTPTSPPPPYGSDWVTLGLKNDA